MSEYDVKQSLMYNIGIQCIKWCRKAYGKRKHRSVPKLELTAKRKVYAEYNYYDNVIEIDIKKHLVKSKNQYTALDTKQYINTIIHEYQHYLQNWTLMKSIGFTKTGKYIDNNIYEQLAIKVAERDYNICIEHLSKKLKLSLDGKSRINLH